MTSCAPLGPPQRKFRTGDAATLTLQPVGSGFSRVHVLAADYAVTGRVLVVDVDRHTAPVWVRPARLNLIGGEK